MLANALENEKIWRHFAAVERILFRTRELDRLIEELLREIKDRFRTGLLVLFLSHPEALERFFQGEPGTSREIDSKTWISPLDGESAHALIRTRAQARALFDGTKRLSPDVLCERPYTALRGADPAKDR